MPGADAFRFSLSWPSGNVTPAIVIPRSAGAGSRPEIGTPLRADWAIVCGEFALSSGFASFGSAGVVGWPAGGV